MAELKTKPTDADINAFIAAIPDNTRRADCETLLRLMKRVTKAKPKLWGNGVVGFGTHHYKYPTGNEGDWYLTGFSPRKNDLSVHIMAGFDQYGDLMAQLGKYKAGKSCLYIKRLADIDPAVLEELIAASTNHVKAIFPT